MGKIINREYIINEGVFVLYNTLEPLYDKYKYTLPEKIKKQLKQIVDDTEELIGDDEDLTSEYDIIKEDLVLKLKYKKFVAKPVKVRKESR